MNAPAYVTRLILPALAVALAAAGAAPAAPAPDKVFLAPHRAVYDLKLSKSHGGRSIEAVRGRILYDFSGNACDGYELQFRQVSELDSGEGKSAVSDLRSTTWEDAAAKKFRFNSENLLNEHQTDAVDGHAERDAAAVSVSLSKPKEKTFTEPVNAVFPTEHMRRIIIAAREGKSILEFPVYDGSESGEKLYNTLTVIGHAIAARSQADRRCRSENRQARQADALAGHHQLFRAAERKRRACGRTDAGLFHRLRALRERHFARAHARLSGLHHQRHDDVAGDEERKALQVTLLRFRQV